MSHITRIELLIQDIPALERAARALRFTLDKRSEFGTYYGPYGEKSPYTGQVYIPPEGHEQDGRGAAFVLRRAGTAAGEEFEIGVIPKAGGGYELRYDSWRPYTDVDNGTYNGRNKIENDAGTGLGKLKQWYGIEVARALYTKQGFRVQTTRNPKTGQPRLVAVKG